MEVFEIQYLSVLDARSALWRHRKREWLDIIGPESESREKTLYDSSAMRFPGLYARTKEVRERLGISFDEYIEQYGPEDIREAKEYSKMSDGVSTFDPVLAEIIYEWFIPGQCARTQVELAQYQYLLPRLTRMWTHLERQRGGIGMRGPGETQIETDRRIILDNISRLKNELQHIDRQKSIQRKNRGKLTRIALVGYTNVGKSTLMNLLSKSEVFAENKLFATLDTTVRKVIIDNLPFLLTDTVGFIRKLPTHLVDSFKSTLDEVREADILVHVVDISHPGFEEQIEVVNKTLQEVCGAEAKPMIMVFNKIDAFTYTPKDPDDLTPSTRENISLEDFRNTWMAKMANNCVFISAKERTNIDALKGLLYQKAKEIHTERFPYNDFLFQKYDEDYDGQ